VDGLVASGAGAELVGSVRRYDEDLAGPADDLLLADGEGGIPAPDDERLGVRVLVQARADTLLGGGLEDQRDAGPTGEELVDLRPVLAVLPPVGAVDHGSAGVRDLGHHRSPLRFLPP